MQLTMKLLKTVHDKLVANVNNINTSGFVLKTKYDTDKHFSEPTGLTTSANSMF